MLKNSERRRVSRELKKKKRRRMRGNSERRKVSEAILSDRGCEGILKEGE